MCVHNIPVITNHLGEAQNSLYSKRESLYPGRFSNEVKVYSPPKLVLSGHSAYPPFVITGTPIIMNHLGEGKNSL